MAGLIIGAALLVLAAAFALGMWAGLGLAEDRRQRADCDALWARTAARAPRARLLPGAAPPPRAPARLPGYAEAFPRPGRLDTGPDVTLMSMPHGRDSRPAPSPAGLDPAVRQTDTELYAAQLAARTRHAERNYLW